MGDEALRGDWVEQGPQQPWLHPHAGPLPRGTRTQGRGQGPHLGHCAHVRDKDPSPPISSSPLADTQVRFMADWVSLSYH